jgi:hypothetical protein
MVPLLVPPLTSNVLFVIFGHTEQKLIESRDILVSEIDQNFENDFVTIGFHKKL